MTELKFINANPKNKKTTDCVVRALAVATGESYEDVIDDLGALWKQTGVCFNDKQNYGRYLADKGFVKVTQPRRSDGTKRPVGEIDSLVDGQTAVVSMPGHLVAFRDGAIHDIWDCRRKKIGNYYIRREY